MVRENSRPISGDTGLADIRTIAERGEFVVADKGRVILNADKTAYIDKLMSFVNTTKFTPKKNRGKQWQRLGRACG